MSNFFNEFDHVTKEEWSRKIHSDLRGKDPSLLQSKDSVEELDYACFYHSDDQISSGNPGSFPFKRGALKLKNEWRNGALVEVNDPSEANKKALSLLMMGADLIWFKSIKPGIDWSIVLKGIQLEHIRAQFTPNSVEDLMSIKKSIGSSNNVQFNVDTIGKNQAQMIKEFGDSLGKTSQPYLLVNGFGVQQSGATTWQEIAFCLNAGHEYLVNLMHQGKNIDQAAGSISFHIGIGSNYFFEMAKIRALRMLWSKIIKAYKPASENLFSCSITALVGHMNKSLADPYTNLLRQTTETMSALSCGVDEIIVLPYDLHSTKGVSELAERMALNIPLILKEESYFDMVLDPLGGSYMLEQMTEMIGKKAWSEFQLLEKEGGLFNELARNSFIRKVGIKRSQRIERFESDGHILIGINKFSNPENIDTKWQELPNYLGMDALNFEQTSKNVSA